MDWTHKNVKNKLINHWKQKLSTHKNQTQWNSISRACKSVLLEVWWLECYLLTNSSLSPVSLWETKPTAVLASFPSPAQLSVTCSMRVWRAKEIGYFCLCDSTIFILWHPTSPILLVSSVVVSFWSYAYTQFVSSGLLTCFCVQSSPGHAHNKDLVEAMQVPSLVSCYSSDP